MAAGRAEEFVFFYSKHKEPDSEARRKTLPQSSDPVELEVRHKQPRTWKHVDLGFKSVGIAVNKAAESILSRSSPKSFRSLCKHIITLLKDLGTNHKGIIPKIIIEDLKQTEKIIEEREICISAYGQHNCGKSTLLNAFVGDECLPVQVTSETSMQVKVQHDENVHLAACSEEVCNSSQKKCPELHMRFEGSGRETVIRGADDIYRHLEAMNKKARSEKEDPPELILKVNIPMLAENVPPEWIISLVDNPGFGDTKKHISQLAASSVSSSCAYIYLLQAENIDGIEADEFFKALHERDTGALTDGRLIVGINKLDIVYDGQRTRRRNRASLVSADELCQKVIGNIHDATKVFVSPDTVIPMCSIWAHSSEKLSRQLNSCEVECSVVEEAREYLEKYPDLSLPGGEREPQKDIISVLSQKDLVKYLEEASGLTSLKARVRNIVGKSCVKVWATKVITIFQHYEDQVVKKIDERCKELGHLIEGNTKDGSKSKVHYSEILKDIDRIREDRKGGLLMKLKEAYKRDLEQSEPQKKWMQVVTERVRKFKEFCEDRIEEKNFGPKEFEKAITDFLEESATRLQNVVDRSLGVSNMHQVLMESTVAMCVDFTNLYVKASHLCEESDTEDGVFKKAKKNSEPSDIGHTITNPVLVLSDIRSRVHIPSVTIPWWMELWRMLKVFLQLTKVGEDRDVYLCTTTEFEESLKQLQQGLVKKCDSYCKTIEDHTINFFYKIFCRQTSIQLKKFQRKYSFPLEEQMKKFDEEYKTMVEEKLALEEKKDSICSLMQDLYYVCSTEYLGYNIEYTPIVGRL